MTHQECINDILNRLKNNKLVSQMDNFNPLGENAIKELLRKDLIKKTNDIYELTNKGYDAIKTGLNYPECLPVKIEIIPPVNIHGHYIGGNVHDSHLNIDNRPAIELVNKKTAQSKPKASVLEIFYWITAVIVCLITIYEFYLKHHLKWLP